VIRRALRKLQQLRITALHFNLNSTHGVMSPPAHETIPFWKFVFDYRGVALVFAQIGNLTTEIIKKNPLVFELAKSKMRYKIAVVTLFGGNKIIRNHNTYVHVIVM
jgi:hypothetical protein